MPNGKTHRAFTVAGAAGILVSGIAVGIPEIASSAALGCLVGVFVHPDLDQAERTNSIWKPYGMLIRHRSWVSHAPVIGTVIRVLYLFGALFAIGWMIWPRLELLGISNLLLALPIREYINWTTLVGLMFSDLIHAMLDIMSTLFDERQNHEQKFYNRRNPKNSRG